MIEKSQELEQEIKSLDDHAVQRVIREMCTDTLEICQLGLNEKARKRVLRNCSLRYAYFLMNDMDYFSRGRVKEAEILESVISMINTIRAIRNRAEII